MKAVIFKNKESGLQYLDRESGVNSEENEVVVQILFSALNRRDYWITKGLYPGIQDNVVLGSDAVGIYDGDRVVINPGLNWGEDERVQSNDFQVLGMPSDGTFSSEISISKDYIYPVPAHLSDQEAAAIPLAGLTAYRVLFTRCKLQENENVLISGVGGGVAHFALLFSVAAGANVYVTSSSQLKIDKAIKLGAKGGVKYSQKNWANDLKSSVKDGFDVIIDSAGGEGFKEFISLCSPGGRIGIYGGTRGKIQSVNPQILFWRQISILGSTMGSPTDFVNMLKFVEFHKIHPIVDAEIPMSNYEKAFTRMEESNQFGKIILNNAL